MLDVIDFYIKTFSKPDLLKVSVQRAFSPEEDPIELSVNPDKTTLAEFAKLYFSELNKKYVYSIGQTEYTTRNYLIHEDFTFYFAGAKYSSNDSYRKNRLLSEILKTSGLDKNNDVIINSGIYVLGKRNYCLNSHVRREVKPSSQKMQVHIKAFYSNCVVMQTDKSEPLGSFIIKAISTCFNMKPSYYARHRGFEYINTFLSVYGVSLNNQELNKPISNFIQPESTIRLICRSTGPQSKDKLDKVENMIRVFCDSEADKNEPFFEKATIMKLQNSLNHSKFSDFKSNKFSNYLQKNDEIVAESNEISISAYLSC